MSKRLTRQKAFIDLVLNSETNQANALIETITDDQALTLIEILLNLHRLKVSRQTSQLLIKRKRLFRQLMSSKVKSQRKKYLIKKHRRQILDTLKSVKSKLLGLLK